MIDEEQLWEMYKTMSIAEMIEKLGLPKAEVMRHLKQYKFYERVKGGIEVSCSKCGKKFTVTSKRVHVCPDCLVKPSRSRPKDTPISPARYNTRRIRPYTYTSNLLIQGCIDEGMDIADIAVLLDRDADDLCEHIQYMQENNIFEKMRGVREEYQKEVQYRAALVSDKKEVPY